MKLSPSDRTVASTVVRVCEDRLYSPLLGEWGSVSGIVSFFVSGVCFLLLVGGASVSWCWFRYLVVLVLLGCVLWVCVLVCGLVVVLVGVVFLSIRVSYFLG